MYICCLMSAVGVVFIQVEQEVLRCVHLLSDECCGCFYTGMARGVIAGVVVIFIQVWQEELQAYTAVVC